ncbi:MAG: metallophosphoesterase family protein [Candidatus Hydrogenedens sp.]
MKIIHITDLHFFQFPGNVLKLFNKRILGCLNWELNRKRRFDFTSIEQFITLLSQYKNATIIVSGDLTVTALEEEFLLAKNFLDTVQKKGFPIYIIPGNHDYYTFEAIRYKRYENLFSEYFIPEDYPAIIYLSDGTPLILIHTVRPNLISSRGVIDTKQLKRLEKIIVSLDRPAIVCGHYPVLHQTPEYYSSYSRRLKNSNLLRKILIQTTVPLLYLAGHVHHYSVNKDDTQPLITYLCSPPLFYSQPRKGGFSEITLKDNQFNIQMKTLY